MEVGIRGEVGCDDDDDAWRGNAATTCSSRDTGRERGGEAKSESSLSETGALSMDSTKLLDISGSDTYAYEDCVDIVDAVDVVRSRTDDGRGSSCHIDVFAFTFPYSCPYQQS